LSLISTHLQGREAKGAPFTNNSKRDVAVHSLCKFIR
jgi:hypothetical protein